MNIGLRFSKSQARVLNAIAARAKTKDLKADVTLFEKAADSAKKGEPLIVGCNSVDEVKRMAEGFVLLGVKRPTLEELSG